MEAVMTLYGDRRLAAITALSLVLAGLSVTSVRAQAIHEGKLTGIVYAEDRAALPGATVEISSPALLAGKKSTTVSAKGMYVFLNLPVGVYTVTASMSGFKTMVRENIEVSPDSAMTLDIVLPVGAVTETVTVTAEGPIVDTKTSTIDSKIDKDMLAKLPTTRDAFYDLSLTTPGMVEGTGNNSLPSPTAYGSSTNENVFLVNGVNSTDPEAGSFGTLVNVNYDAVEEVRVVALGSKAEYGSYSGAAIDVLTKSGSNAYHGSGAFYSLLGKPANNQPAPGPYPGSDFLYVPEDVQLAGDVKSDWEGSATLGGPIVKDKVWFFGAYNYLRGSELPPRWSLTNESWRNYADAKISAAPLKNHRFWAAYHYEHNDGNGWSWGSEPAWQTEGTYGAVTVNNTASAQWQWFPSGTTTASAKFLGFWKNDKPYIPSSAPSNPCYVNWWKLTDEAWCVNGAFPYVDAQKAKRQTIQADVSHFAESFLGQHDIKVGVQYTKGRGNRQEGYFQNYANFLYPLSSSQDVSYLKSYYSQTGLLFYNYHDRINSTLTVRTSDSKGAFFDDQWSVGKRLTLNLGLRYDRMTAKYDGGAVYDFVTAPDQVNGPPPILRDRAGTGNIFDFKTWSPRIGLTYQLTGDGKTVARAAYGRYYLPLSIENLRRFGPDMPALNRTYQIYEVPWSIADANGDGFLSTTEIRNAATAVHGLTPISEEQQQNNASWTLNVAPNLKDQHTDQFTVSFERELARNFSVSATYVYKHTTDIFASVPINRVTGQEWDYVRVPFTTSTGQTVMLYGIAERDYNGDGVIDDADVRWVNSNNTSKVMNLGSYDGVKPERNYHALQVVFNKRFSDRSQSLASFVYSTSSGMGRRTLRQDVNVEGPMFWDDTWMSSLNDTINNLQGQLPFTPTYEVKLSGSYKIPKIEADFGVRWRWHSGRGMWLTEAIPQHTQWANPPGSVIDVGSLGRIVATDQPTYLPNLSLLDLHLEKAVNLGGPRKLHLMVDGFNMMNVDTPTDIDVQYEWGKVTSIPSSRRFRFGARFEF
jgi:hypothetical protein